LILFLPLGPPYMRAARFLFLIRKNNFSLVLYSLIRTFASKKKMRVLIVNTSERTGGAAVAANRLMKALNNNGVKAMMLVGDKETDALTVVSLPKSWHLRWHFLWERLVIFVRSRFSRKHLFEIDL